MIVTTGPDSASSGALAAAVQLLFRAADLAWAHAEVEGPLSAGHLTGLRVHLAACQGLDLLPDGVEPDGDAPELVGTDVGELLDTAQRLLRTAPIAAFPPGTSVLVTVLNDLVQETTA